ncbi:leucyl/phenylalanyl-tRNA--protein transferase [Gluconacetobacter sacchari]|nr:leucyl/phenylalanyl-tRNA--protein transferase [Gluconacetobacter sacchari]
MDITPEIMIQAYSIGLFPMAPDARSPRLEWYDPESRGVLPLDGFHAPRRLLRTVLSDRFEIVSDRDFEATIRACAAPAPGREETWINERIVRLFCDLHALGHAHSVESWQGGELVGGLYGVAIGGAFFGESMFSRARDSSKAALVSLVARLRRGGFTLLDTQFGTAHLALFGGIEIPSWRYKAHLAAALRLPARWPDETRPREREAIRHEIIAMRDARGADAISSGGGSG